MRTDDGSFVIEHLRCYPHPDNRLNTKWSWIKRLKQHVGLPAHRQVWVWLDIISIPQRDRELQLRAIHSLCAYTQLCTRFVPLVRNAAAWVV